MSERRRSFFGWGYEDDAVSADEIGWFERAWSSSFTSTASIPAPLPREVGNHLAQASGVGARQLQTFCSEDKYDRLFHCYGRSVHDLARMIHRRDFTNPPDVVAYPRDEADIRAVLDWCGTNDIAAIPFGGGSSVVGGVNPPIDDRYRGTLTIDLQRLNRVLEVDTTSQAARIQAGTLGPDLERQLRPTGLTMRFLSPGMGVLVSRRMDCDARRRPLCNRLHADRRPHREPSRRYAGRRTDNAAAAHVRRGAEP